MPRTSLMIIPSILLLYQVGRRYGKRYGCLFTGIVHKHCDRYGFKINTITNKTISDKEYNTEGNKGASQSK